ncbi:ScbR family autoregulator-binding transcription factor [Lysinibacter cavernae]|uniref:AcrR family transcriptional regulator n=1 Tax=Lysinibacter cavernae TaxID=1640652 RepID=A0A7X5R470_9MICO|nr:ScbR family autoregulator-binding transcription factor [Lysinibacter cavernae]NIH55010.1 AcrR family transcriptional regulator [Lysinibacter cavernae]
MQARAKITRQNIIESSSAVFLRKGFAASTISDIADEANITKGAMYFHFKSKELIARAIIEIQVEANETLHATLEAKQLTSFEAMIEMSHEMSRLIQDNIVYAAATRLAVEVGVFGDPIAQTYDAWNDPVTHLVKATIDDGYVSTTVEPEVLAEFLVTTFTGIQTVSLVQSNYGDLRERIDDMWRIVLPGILAPGNEDLAAKTCDRAAALTA